MAEDTALEDCLRSAMVMHVDLTTALGCCYTVVGQVASAGRLLLGAAAASAAAAASGSAPAPQKFVPVEQQPKKQQEFFEVRCGDHTDSS
jgi:hypothetical protein